MKNANDNPPGCAADVEAEAWFSENLLRIIYDDNDGKPLLAPGTAAEIRRQAIRDYRDLQYTLPELDQDLRRCREAEAFFESIGQRLLAQRAGIRAAAALHLISFITGDTIQ